MKQFLLAVVLIAIPVGVFSAYVHWSGGPTRSASAGLGDMSAFAVIVKDVQGLASGGDLGGAKTRIVDLETAWDDAEPTLRAADPADWGTVDDAIDTALSALRAGTPSPDSVGAALAALSVVLGDPGAATAEQGAGKVVLVEGIATTDETGHALACEDMLTRLRDGLSQAKLSEEQAAKVADLQSKATERCNADDDARSDGFSAQALAILGQ